MVKVCFGYARAVFLAVLLAVCITAVFEIETVQGEAMQPEFVPGESVFINKAAYLYDKPRLGDVVVFETELHTETDGNGILIKRIAGIEGDTVEIDGEEVAVQKGYVYVLGDNAEISLDSRNAAIGQIPIRDIIGRVIEFETEKVSSK